MPTAELNALIRRSVTSKADADYDLIYDSLFERQLYLNITLDPDGSRRMETRELHGVRVVTFFTSNTEPTLKVPYGGMLWRDIITMLAKAPELQGVQIYNDTDDWVIFRTPYLLQRLPGTAQA